MLRRPTRIAGFICALAFAPLAAQPLAAAEKADKGKEKKPEPRLSAGTFAGFEFRNLGPALMSGRIADVALHPNDPNVWFVAVGSGGVWKTTNAGTTWKPVFDGEASYSIGCVTVDPSNPSIVWVGTGENVGGRHVGYGDGVYRSTDGGASWKNLGLKESQHVSKIVVHPSDSNTVWVAAQGPLWSKGGDRGLYKTTDGGATWKKVLGGGDYTGVTDVVLDPRAEAPGNATLYAATWQKHRIVAGYIGGGPESAVHKSTDGGETWTKLESGLPKGSLGKIGLAISPQNPDVVYAAIELDRRTGGVWRSADRGGSWEKRSDAVSGATGPHYYQELYASPHAFDRIYLVDVRVQISEDGGKTFRRMTERNKHSDNHVIVFRKDDPDYLLVGTDGGLYESFDLAENWKFVQNLPVTQFYKVAVDDDAPFYNVYGGTQDNSTQGGPSRTDNVAGIRTSDWFITVFADGHQPATEPGNPNIVYSEWQGGNLVRHDRKTGEIVYIQPQGEPGDEPDRFNWDSPILVSPHDPKRLYYASQRVFRSDDRGDRWRPVSGDLTNDVDRLKLRYQDRQWSYDAPWDLDAMSQYSTITSLAESPQAEGVLYAGTDDGLIQVSEDGGGSWRRIEVGSLPGVPASAFVNDIKADLFDSNTVYVALDDHKSGNFAPMLYASRDRGRSWRSIAGDLPARHLVWRVVQDHVKPELLFAATEFGIFFTVDGGAKWIELTGKLPTISFRDLAIQRRENDLVGASFGRGFFVLDDYSALRSIDETKLSSGALLFPPREAWWYVPRRPLGDSTPGPADQGAAHFVAPNPPFGAVFTYHLAEDRPTRAKKRQEAEKPLAEAGKDTPFPSFAELEAERRESAPALELVVRDAAGTIVRKIEAKASKGFQRVAWDLRHPASSAVTSTTSGGDDGFGDQGSLAAPGRYTATLVERADGATTELAGPVSFEVKPLRSGSLPGATGAEVAAFGLAIDRLQRQTSAAGETLDRAESRLELAAVALARSSGDAALASELHALRQKLYDLEVELGGEPRKNELSVPTPPTIGGRLGVASIGVGFSTYGPTPTHRRSLELAEQGYAAFAPKLKQLVEVEIPAFEKKLEAAGAPWTPGRPLPEVD